MAQYKVPQDVEADDKLLGPFSFRQFVYLMIAGALIALTVGVFQLFPLLAIVPIPGVLFFLALALPLKKDQPMETYLAAILSFYTRPRTRTWETGQRGTAIEIMAPKKVEQPRTRNITGEEATHRLSFLADIVDTEGYAIKGVSSGGTPMREDLIAEASTAVDMFEGSRFDNLGTTIQQEEIERRAEVMGRMQDTIQEAEIVDAAQPSAEGGADYGAPAYAPESVEAAYATPDFAPEVVTTPAMPEGADFNATNSVPGTGTGNFSTAEQLDPSLGVIGADESFVRAMAATGYANGGTGNADTVVETTVPTPKKRPDPQEQSDAVVLPEQEEAEKEDKQPASKPKEEPPVSEKKRKIIALANNDTISVATVAKQAERIKKEDEVFVSLH